jgi:plastocyanin
MLRPMKSGRLISFSSLVLTLGLASACGSSSDDSPDAAPDGSGSGSAKAAEVVNCPTTVSKEIKTETANTYVPNAMTVTAGTIVKFTMNVEHDVRSTTNLFSIGKGQTGCVKFNTAGTYTFGCTPHGFVGTVTVQ